MAWQLIYTSAQRTLTPGQCGYGTVARCSDLREALTQRLEQLSYYTLPTTSTRTGPLPVIHACRVLDLRGSKYLLLSRIVDARLDFTNRTNHLAHHLVFTPAELADVPSPATLLRHWDGWRDGWSEEPRFLDDSDWGNLSRLPRSVALPAVNWARLTGEAGRAAALVDWPSPGGIQLLISPDQESCLLDLFAESLQLLDPENRAPARRWQFPFTTRLQSQDNPADFLWRGCHAPAAAAGSASQRSSAGTLFPLAELPVPETPRAILARRGPGVSPRQPSSLQASPGLVSPADVSAAPLRLSRSTAPADASLPDPLLDDAWVRTERADAPVARIFTRRLLIPLIALLAFGLVLVGGFYRPGWFLERGTTRQSASPAVSSLLPDTVPVVAHPPAVVATTPEAPVAPLTSPAEVPTESKAILEAAFDRIPTYLVHARTDHQGMELGSIQELEALLRRVFGGTQELGSENVRVLAQTGDFRLVVDPTTPEQQPRIDQFEGKKITVGLQGGTNPMVELDCTEWIKDPQRPILLGRVRTADRDLTLVFRPAAGGPGFDPFRLLLLTGQPPKPIELPKVFLRSEPTHWTDALDPDLLERLPRSPTSTVPPFRYQLRMYAGHPATELFGPFLNDYQPAEGSELALEVHRREIQARLAGLGQDQERIQAEAEKLKTKVEISIAKDLQLGVVLGVTKPANLASLNAFVRSKGDPDFPDRNDFLEYLRTLFDRLGLQARDLLGPPRKPTEKDLLQLHGLLVSGLKSKRVNLEAVAPSYFTNRWSEFGSVDLLREFRNQGQSVSNQSARLGILLDRIPPDLNATPRVSLHVVDAKGYRLFELIRFTTPTQDTPP